MKTPPVVSEDDWEAAHAQLLGKEKKLTRASEALTAQRRRIPWLEVEKEYVFEGPQADIERAKVRKGWTMPWYSATDFFDADFGVDQWHGTNAFIRAGDRVCFARTSSTAAATRRWGAYGRISTQPHWGRLEEWEDTPEGYPQTKPYEWWDWHDAYGDTGVPPAGEEQVRWAMEAGPSTVPSAGPTEAEGGRR